MSRIVKRCEKLAFYGVPTESGGYTFHRMRGFDSLSTSKNPKEYSRQYIDEEFEETDVVGYTPSVAFAFDMFALDEVHTDIAAIFDEEKTGADAVRPIVMVDMSSADKCALFRNFAVVAETEGDGLDAYRYSGSLRVKGEIIRGTAESSDDWQTINFTATN